MYYGGEDRNGGDGDGGSRVQISLLLTGMRSLYFWRMRSASAFRFSKGCSSLNLERMIATMDVLELERNRYSRTSCAAREMTTVISFLIRARAATGGVSGLWESKAGTDGERRQFHKDQL